ncbi:MAG: hemolysin family protein [Paracoccus sp. (in: a-proteobacteria)]|uniref:hemolysin family protein n=1 Tax=Paracoccus sp. TaxID=267 RepID=UPI0026E02FC7|nr:hemolysin family protein [Paracoccus sp. (in: a-proteobacteria)]MDO5614508.1 hemolysin family protein [Paracoccus sp. (in: a-proteobacteria)]
MWLEIAIILALTLVNGGLAMAELAVVSSRPMRLRALGGRRADAALRLVDNPGRFLSSVQIGITLVGILNGAVSGATLGLRAGAALAEAGLPAQLAAPAGVGLVVAAITFLSLIVGELVPKQIALSNPEKVAARVALPMTAIARIAAPLVWLLDGAGRIVLGLLGIRRQDAATITDEEIRLTLAEAAQAGVLLPAERAMISGVMRVADRTARAMMTPRRDLTLLDLSRGTDAVMDMARRATFSRLPVIDGNPDEVKGVIALRDLLPQGGNMPDPASVIRPAPVVLDTASAVDVIARLRSTPTRMALVYDEYGHFSGVVTAMDLLAAITGDFIDTEGDEPDMIRREDGSWLVSGAEKADEFAGETGYALPAGEFATVAGLVLHLLGRIPRTGEVFTDRGWRFEVADMDGLRIDKLIVTAPKGDQ